MSTLTQRYIEQVVGHLPEDTRPEISRELEALIGDMVDERIGRQGTGSKPGAGPDGSAERCALEELGDPSRLADRYRIAPNHLIGPQVYPAYVWTMRRVLPLVLLICLAVNLVVYLATEPEPRIGEMIGAVIGSLVVALLGFLGALTLIFALVERTSTPQSLDRMTRGDRQWSAAELKAERPHEPGVRGDAIGGLVLLAVLALLPLVPTTFLYVGDLNDGGSFVNPDLWDLWLPVYWVILAASAAVEVWALISGRWTTRHAAVRIVVHVVLWAFVIILLLTQQVIDPALPNGAGSGDWNLWSQRITAVVLAVVAVWDLVAIFRRWRRLRPTP